MAGGYLRQFFRIVIKEHVTKVKRGQAEFRVKNQIGRDVIRRFRPVGTEKVLSCRA